MSIDVVFDIETKDLTDPNLQFKPSNLDVSVVCAYRSDTDELLTYWEEDMPKLEQLFEQADRIIGYNSWGFDEPVLQKYFKLDLKTVRSVDMLEAIRKAIGTRIKLDLVAATTLGQGKIGSGADAGKYWSAGELDKLEKYCKQDVIVTKDLFYLGEKTGKLKYKNGLDEVVEFDVSWQDGERIPEGEGPQQSLF